MAFSQDGFASKRINMQLDCALFLARKKYEFFEFNCQPPMVQTPLKLDRTWPFPSTPPFSIATFQCIDDQCWWSSPFPLSIRFMSCLRRYRTMAPKARGSSSSNSFWRMVRMVLARAHMLRSVLWIHGSSLAHSGVGVKASHFFVLN